MAHSSEVRVSKRCPNCGWRVLDKVTPTTGIIEIKCSHCGKPVKIDLSFRRAIRSERIYRRMAVR